MLEAELNDGSSSGVVLGGSWEGLGSISRGFGGGFGRIWCDLGKQLEGFGDDLARVLKGLRASWSLLRVSGLLGGVVGRF